MRGNIWRLQQNRQKQLWLKRGHESQSAAFYSCGLCYFQIKDNGFDSKLKHRRSHLLDRPAAPLQWRQCFGLDRWETISSHLCVFKKMLFATTWGEEAQGTTFTWTAIIWGMMGRPELFQGTLNYCSVEVQLQQIQAWLVFHLYLHSDKNYKQIPIKMLEKFQCMASLKHTPFNKNLLHNWPHTFSYNSKNLEFHFRPSFWTPSRSQRGFNMWHSQQCATQISGYAWWSEQCTVTGHHNSVNSVNSEHMKERAWRKFPHISSPAYLYCCKYIFIYGSKYIF